jgi:hypothetical protein
MDMQNLIINEIKNAAKEHGFTVMQEPNWSNTGNLLFLKAGSFNAKADIYYNFQSTCAILNAKVNGKNLLPQAHRSSYFDYYLKYDDMDELFAQLMTQLFDALDC